MGVWPVSLAHHTRGIRTRRCQSEVDFPAHVQQDLVRASGIPQGEMDRLCWNETLTTIPRPVSRRVTSRLPRCGRFGAESPRNIRGSSLCMSSLSGGPLTPQTERFAQVRGGRWSRFGHRTITRPHISRQAQQTMGCGTSSQRLLYASALFMAEIGLDYPYSWPPHQILAWVGIERYGFLHEAARLAYRWL